MRLALERADDRRRQKKGLACASSSLRIRKRPSFRGVHALIPYPLRHTIQRTSLSITPSLAYSSLESSRWYCWDAEIDSGGLGHAIGAVISTKRFPSLSLRCVALQMLVLQLGPGKGQQKPQPQWRGGGDDLDVSLTVATNRWAY